MPTYHIQVKGIVQGVGFRPFVYRLARQHKLNGTVCNTTDGVHIYISTHLEKAQNFYNDIKTNPPERAVIMEASMDEVELRDYKDFNIIESHGSNNTSVLLTPDYALCENCRHEFHDPSDKRHLYPFITCTLCGPRYSIIKSLPYDRHLTTMNSFEMCHSCMEEYESIHDRRYYSQTNSCHACSIQLTIEPPISGFDQVENVLKSWEEGKIVAIKGIGGYLLTCDATDHEVIKKLRDKKYRPSKPLAVMYPDLETLKKDAIVNKRIENELKSPESPIVLIEVRKQIESGLNMNGIAPGLNHIGAMIPYAPIYELLLSRFNKPIVATSGNLSGDPIEFTDRGATENLNEIADVILHNNRDIVVPQDDSVVGFSINHNKRIVIRRSRGMAPTYLNYDHKLSPDGTILAMGGLLKSTFGLITQGNIYISQYLGDTDSFNTQNNFKNVLNHILKVTKSTPQKIICDAHPGFYSSQEAEKSGEEWGIEVKKVQHHKAHFAAVMGENNLFASQDKVLGIIWDGVGLGDDGGIWGGEVFSYERNKMKRLGHIPPFKYFLGDKMAKEPRISAFTLLHSYDLPTGMIKHKFNSNERSIYNKLISNENISTTSIGRVYDGVASLLLDIDKQTYEGEAAMKLEAAGTRYYRKLIREGIQVKPSGYKSFEEIIQGVINKKNNDPEETSFLFHLSLVDYICQTIEKEQGEAIAFSGGVFQNRLLVDLITDLLGEKYKLFWHKQLSPNDENISFGQLMYDLYNLD